MVTGVLSWLKELHRSVTMTSTAVGVSMAFFRASRESSATLICCAVWVSRLLYVRSSPKSPCTLAFCGTLPAYHYQTNAPVCFYQIQGTFNT